ncbi:FliM/FliN family flagellar motor switch protein [Spartinivicinus ruber]|uniref:FliM/FliN family flagellar motor switch protein n=1 Tax=Spartinivicinus ruber TaxID=2683272 RepID=UPI0013D4F552|nr:FliM/FliN family flagellar motor C-terminal domain-containing protein [Spartinivicinus ruber]
MAIADLVSDWCKKWFFNTVECQSVVTPAWQVTDSIDMQANTTYQLKDDGVGCLLLEEESFRLMLMDYLLGQSVAEQVESSEKGVNHPVVKALINKCQEDFQQLLDVRQDVSILPKAWTLSSQYASGWLYATISLADVWVVGLLFDPANWLITKNLLKYLPKTKASYELADKYDSIKHESVEVIAELGCSSLSVSQLATLQVGDIITLDRSLADGVMIKSLSGDNIVTGLLGTHEGNKAIVVKKAK